MGWPDSPPSNMRCCGGDKKDSRPLVPGPQLPGKLHAALASHTDVQTEQVEPRPLPHRGFQILRAGKGPPLVLHVPSAGYPPVWRRFLPAWVPKESAAYSRSMQRRNCARQMGQKQRQIYRHARLPQRHLHLQHQRADLQSGDDSGSGRIKGKPPGNPGGSALLETFEAILLSQPG